MKKGRVKISNVFFAEENLGALKAVFSIMYPYRIDKSSEPFYSEYYCIGDCFDEVEEGTRIPEYEITINNSDPDNKKITVSYID